MSDTASFCQFLNILAEAESPSWLLKVASGEHPCQPPPVGGSHQSASTQEVAPVQPPGPRLPPAENSAEACTQDQEDQTILDEQYIKVCEEKTASYGCVAMETIARMTAYN